jgi:hypothetical protein
MRPGPRRRVGPTDDLKAANIIGRAPFSHLPARSGRARRAADRTTWRAGGIRAANGDAARTLSLLIVRASGYRPRTVGGHYNTFLALEAADSGFAKLSAYFDGCRIKRNNCEYDYAGGTSDTDADALLASVKQFQQDAEAWIKARYPAFS